LAAAAGNAPLLDPAQVILFAHGRSHSTRFERAKIERLGLARLGLEEVTGNPEQAASRATPLSEHPSRNTGLKLDQMLRVLKVLASGPGLVAITLAELNPHNAAADDGSLERFAASLAKPSADVAAKKEVRAFR
jgi:arginase